MRIAPTRGQWLVAGLIVVVLLLMCLPTVQTIRWLGQASDPSDTALETIEQYCNKELRDLGNEERQTLREAIQSLVPDRQYKEHWDFVPWYIWQFTRKSDRPSYVVFEVDNSPMPHPGSTLLRITLIDSTGKFLSETKFNTAHRCYLRRVELAKPFEGEYPIIVLTTGPGPGPGPNFARQYYSRIGDRMDLVRIEDSEQGATRNDYYIRHFRCGPPVPAQTAADWESDLMAREPFRVLRALVWLGGVHWELRQGDLQEPQAEKIQEARLVRKVRKRPAVLARLKEMAEGKDEWLRQGALLALDAKDDRWSQNPPMKPRDAAAAPGQPQFSDRPIRTVPALSEKDVPQLTDRYGDLLSPGALLRLGTVRFRHGAKTIETVTYSPDGQTIAAGDDTGFIRMWDARTGKELWSVRPHRTVICLAFAPDGKLLASAGPSAASQVWVLWDARTGQEKRRHVVESGEFVGGLEFSSDGKILAVAIPNDHVIRLLDASSSKELCKLKAFCDQPSDLSFSPDGSLLAGKGLEGGVRLWQSATGKEVKHLPNTEDSTGVRFSPDGKSLAVGSYEEIHIFAVSDGTLRRQLSGLSGWKCSMAFTPDGTMLVAGNVDGNVILWNVATGQQVRSVGKYPGSVVSVSLSPDGKTIAVGAFGDGALRLADIATGKEVFPHTLGSFVVRAAALAPDGNSLAIAGNLQSLEIRDVKTGTVRWAQTESDGHIGDIAFSPDGQTLAVGTSGGTLYLRDAESGRLIRNWKAHRRGDLTCIAFSPDGLSLACADLSKMISVSDVKAGKVRYQFSTTDLAVRTVAFSPNARFLATASNHGSLRLWSAQNGEAWYSFPEYTEGVQAFTYSPNGMMIASSGRKGPILLTEAASGKARARLNGAGDSVTALAFDPEGVTLAAGNSQGSIRLIDLMESKEWLSLDGHRGAVDSLQFSADGRLLLSKSHDTTALVWDLSMLSNKRKSLPPVRLSRQTFEALWRDLAGEDASKAFRSVLTLAAAKDSAALIKEQVLESTRSHSWRQEQIKQSIAALRSVDVTTREKAMHELKNFPDESEPWVRGLMADNLPEEIREGVEDLLESLQGACPAPETLRLLRAVEALETMATPDAREALRAFTRESPELRLRQEAQAALQRLEKIQIKR